ncbi:TPA: aspartate aminotransferase [Candidatus Sumerlaeota bacterium]|nr:aspartate aminotransferase [Candidatus Sumerlaeota bacterium]
MISQPSQSISASGIRKVFDLAQTLKDPINLSIGQPDFDVPDPVKQSAIDAITQGKNRYTVTQGIPQIHQRLREEHAKHGYSPEDILITSGVSGGIVLALLALCDPGDEILVPDPYFVMYKHLATLFGVTPRFVDTYPDFRLREEAIEAQITSKTKVIIINSPANPTGIATSDEELQMVARVAKKHDLYVLFDEIYACFNYNNAHASITKYYDKVLLLNGFSKSHAMTGWRLGYAMGPKDVIQEMTKLQQYTFVCAPAMAQWAGIAALDLPMDATNEAYRRKRDIIYDGLKDKFNVQKPDGAFYIFPEAPGGNATEFVTKAIQNNVLIIPGNVFSERDTHFRISFAATDETLYKGIEVLNKLA